MVNFSILRATHTLNPESHFHFEIPNPYLGSDYGKSGIPKNLLATL